MIKIHEKLTVLHDDNSSFVDFTRECASYDRDTASLTYVAADDFIYVGFYKPINTFYVEFSTANTNAADLTVEFYNGSSYTDVVGLYDDTNGFTRSGFVRWDRGQTSEAAATVNSLEKYWYRLSLDVDSSAMVIGGLNIVFSDDQDLKRELYEYTKYLPSGASSHILTHEAARDEIIQTLNIMGKEKYLSATDIYKDITAFDLLDISEVKLASTYLVLAKIFMNVSDEVDDAYLQKSGIYRKKFNDIIQNMRLKVDVDDDGLDDENDRQDNFFGRIIRA